MIIVEERSVICDRCRMPASLTEERLCEFCVLRVPNDMPGISWAVFTELMILAALVGVILTIVASAF